MELDLFGQSVPVNRALGRGKRKYNRREAEERFARVFEPVAGDRCIYCGMPSEGKVDHQPPVYVLHRFANGELVTKRDIQRQFGQCKLVPCCTICNMGLGAYHGADDNERRREIVGWFLEDDRFPEDKLILDMGDRLIEQRAAGKRGTEVYAFPGVGRRIYIQALVGFIEGDFNHFDGFPEWLRLAQLELADWLRATPGRKAQYFLKMARLESYNLLPHARSDPRGQF
ncbi:hypothetical protein HFO94_12490 [Rhizobium leguminosarum]|uniref:hypothetical protein n=1 Tax=Rhizobium leguminosarum TaxID=384 RepID=UPI001C94E27D|nr:hypothetical protein [Rhizobium leguminosarum]MBY5354344.1 hypothetical protein [Rhizobium leguminosarum]